MLSTVRYVRIEICMTLTHVYISTCGLSHVPVCIYMPVAKCIKLSKSKSKISLSAPGDRWCSVLGFVPAGYVSSSSTRLQILQDASHYLCDGCFTRHSISPIISLGPSMSKTADPRECSPVSLSARSLPLTPACP